MSIETKTTAVTASRNRLPVTRQGLARACGFAVLALALLAPLPGASQTLVIDNFDTSHPEISVTTPGTDGSSVQGEGIIGGERDITVELLNSGIPGNGLDVVAAVSVYSHSQSALVTGRSWLTWDGQDGDQFENFDGLDGVDLTQGGTQDAIEIQVLSVDHSVVMVLEVYTNAAHSSAVSLTFTQDANSEAFLVPFSAFGVVNGSGADFSDVGAVKLTIDGSAVPALDGVLDVLGTGSLLDAEKTVVDVNGGAVEPGDILEYTVVVSNPDDGADASATMVQLTDVVGPGLELLCVNPAPTTTLGTIADCTQGVGGSLAVDLGTVIEEAAGVVTFQAQVMNPFPAGLDEVCNQGLVISSSLSGLPTDDPLLTGFADETCTPVFAGPDLEALKTTSLLIDNNGDGIAGAGDSLGYVVTLTNNGNQDAAAITFTDSVDPNSVLRCDLPGTPTTSQGTITDCAPGAGGSLAADIGTVSGGGGSVTLNYEVTLPNPFPVGVTVVCNQGQFGPSGLPTDDPSTGTPQDPTCEPVLALPMIDAIKTDALLTDVNGDGEAGPGDLLLYEVQIFNTGKQTATMVLFSDAVDQYSSLLCQESDGPSTSHGAVASCQPGSGGDFAVDIGDLPVGDVATITYYASVMMPPAGVDQVCNQGIVNGGNFGGQPTDDPDSGATDDPTCTPVERGPMPSIPTLGEWGLILLVALMALAAAATLRRRQAGI